MKHKLIPIIAIAISLTSCTLEISSKQIEKSIIVCKKNDGLHHINIKHIRGIIGQLGISRVKCNDGAYYNVLTTYSNTE